MNQDLKKIRHSGWVWRIAEPACLDPWFEEYPRFEEENRVKRNPVRTVFRVQDTRGNAYFVKHDNPEGLHGTVKALFRSKTKQEFQSSLLLKKLGIPCVEYCGFASKFPESMLISRAIPESMSAKEFWFRHAVKDSAIRQDFLSKLVMLCRQLLGNRIVHADFHAGNVLVSGTDHQLFLVDPYGIRRAFFPLTPFQKTQLIRIFTNLRGEIKTDEVLSLLLDAGFADTREEVRILWNSAVNAEVEEVLHTWKRRQKQILEGTSKFAVFSEENGRYVFRRNTLWYTPQEFNLVRLRPLRKSHTEARQLWLDSFLSQLMREKNPQIPLVWSFDPASPVDDILYFE